MSGLLVVCVVRVLFNSMHAYFLLLLLSLFSSSHCRWLSNVLLGIQFGEVSSTGEYTKYNPVFNHAT